MASGRAGTFNNPVYQQAEDRIVMTDGDMATGDASIDGYADVPASDASGGYVDVNTDGGYLDTNGAEDASEQEVLDGFDA